MVSQIFRNCQITLPLTNTIFISRSMQHRCSFKIFCRIFQILIKQKGKTITFPRFIWTQKLLLNCEKNARHFEHLSGQNNMEINNQRVKNRRRKGFIHFLTASISAPARRAALTVFSSFLAAAFGAFFLITTGSQSCVIGPTPDIVSILLSKIGSQDC